MKQKISQRNQTVGKMRLYIRSCHQFPNILSVVKENVMEHLGKHASVPTFLEYIGVIKFRVGVYLKKKSDQKFYQFEH